MTKAMDAAREQFENWVTRRWAMVDGKHKPNLRGGSNRWTDIWCYTYPKTADLFAAWQAGAASKHFPEADSAVGQWISVTERLPDAIMGEEGQKPFVTDDVLIYWGDHCSMDVANYDHEAGRWALVNHGFAEPYCDPTHWMPIPAPPASSTQPSTTEPKENL
jgi:Protein of unknown function (DUF551)